MALVIEDGSEVSGAESYATAAQLVTFAAKYGHTIPASESEQETLLRNAMHAAEGRNWKGDRVSSTQDLPFPRTGVYVDRQLLSYTDIPRQMLYGQLNLAVESYTTDMLPVRDANTKGAVTEERVEGAITVKYTNTGKVYHTPASAKADAHLKQLERNSGLKLTRS